MIQKSDISRISRRLGLRTGINMNGSSGSLDGYQYLEFHTTTTPPSPDGFAIRVHLLWKSIEISFIPDTFARNLIESMGDSPEGNLAFSVLADSAVRQSCIIEFIVNEKSADPVNPETWDLHWDKLRLKLSIFTDGTDPSDFEAAEDFLVRWLCHFLKMVISLMPVEEDSPDSPETKGLPEGSVCRVTVNKYERNPVNRSACIAVHGCYCHVCGLKFDQKYGEIGEGFIHVHHITPVSQLGSDYSIDPSRDLIPVCPNCHAMLHRCNPPLDIEQLKKRMKE